MHSNRTAIARDTAIDTARYGQQVGTGFLTGLLTRDLSDTKRGLLEHPLWRGLETGETSRAQLAQFALQDAWLIREVHRLDGLTIAKAPNAEAAAPLIRKLTPKGGALDTLVRFGVAVGLRPEDFGDVRPLAACAGLTTQFYYHLARSSFAETVACIGASETIFLEICGRIERPLRERYGLQEDDIAFFTFHEALEHAQEDLNTLVGSLVHSDAEREAVTRAVELCYDFERLFYDAIRAQG